MEKIVYLRKKIDNLDLLILNALKERYGLIMEITALKQKKGLSIRQAAREKKQIDKLFQMYGKDINLNLYINNIFKFILKESKISQKKVVGQFTKH